MSIWKELRRVLARMRPWPSRADRRAAVEHAQAQAAESRREAQKAEVLKAEMRRMSRTNHFAEAIAKQLREGR